MRPLNRLRRTLSGSGAPAPDRDFVPISAAVLAIDISGYGRLIAADESGTLARVEALEAEVIKPAIAKRRSFYAQTYEDVTLAAFDSALGALSAAVEMQQAVTRREAKLPAERRLAIRVGIYLGPCIIEKDGVMGDIWSLALHLATKAPPGGIYFSENVWFDVRDTSGHKFEDVGDVITAKNIRNRRAYTVKLD